jgi:hypothetical protein
VKFTIKKKQLAQMLRAMTQNTGRKRGERDRHLRLVAQDGRITMRANDAEAGCQANVLEEGVCFLRYNQFLPLVRTYSNAADLTIDADIDEVIKTIRGFAQEIW